MSTETAGRDPNYVPSIMGLSLGAPHEPTAVYVDEVTHRLLVSAVISSDTTYESYTDTTTDVNLVYLGKATPGSATSDAAWQIKRYNKSTGQMSFADDITTFTKVWSDRTTYTY